MNLKHYPVEKLKKRIKLIVSRYLNLSEYRIFIFGSRILNKGDDRSDIDIGIEGNKEIPYETMFKIKEEIEEIPVLYKIDIVDFNKVSEDFKKVSMKFIELI